MSHEDEEVKNGVATWLRAKAAQIHDVGIQKLVPTLDKYLDKCCDYVKKIAKSMCSRFFTRFC